MAEKSETPAPESKTATATAPAPNAAKPKKLPPYNVVLLNDEEHTYAYVIEMLGKLFAHPKERAYALTKTVDTTGRAIVLTTHKELAELKRDQIHAFGADVRMASSAGSMSAIIEPAQS